MLGARIAQSQASVGSSARWPELGHPKTHSRAPVVTHAVTHADRTVWCDPDVFLLGCLLVVRGPCELNLRIRSPTQTTHNSVVINAKRMLLLNSGSINSVHKSKLRCMLRVLAAHPAALFVGCVLHYCASPATNTFWLSMRMITLSPHEL